jgi:NAD+ synthase
VGSPEEWQAIITAFLREHTSRAHATGVVVGISGGVDSALAAALCAQALGHDQVLGIRMPHAESDPDDVALGERVCEHLGIESVTRDITPIVAGLEQALGRRPDAFVHGNAKARARMMFLYAEAQQRKRLVCGTGNKSELLLGYFTKHGDGGVDMQPLGDLYKTQVWQLARHMGLPAQVVERAPSAGLHPGQTDEQELGLAYRDLDAILKGFELNGSPDAVARRTGVPLAEVERIDALVRSTEHKRHAPLVPKIGGRTLGIDWRRPVHWDASRR